MDDERAEIKELMANIKASLPELETLLTEVCGAWTYEDLIYRFYHGSFKVYWVQNVTKAIVEKLQGLAPDLPLNERFMKIVSEGTNRVFTVEDNARWDEVTRPMLEAFFHAKYFLEMVVKYGKTLDAPPGSMLSSGWAAVLYLYDRR
jgi:hypothetical protein